MLKLIHCATISLKVSCQDRWCMSIKAVSLIFIKTAACPPCETQIRDIAINFTSLPFVFKKLKAHALALKSTLTLISRLGKLYHIDKSLLFVVLLLPCINSASQCVLVRKSEAHPPVALSFAGTVTVQFDVSPIPLPSAH